MSRSSRAVLASQTVEIVERGSYRSAGGVDVNIAGAVRACLDGTRFYPPEELERLRREVLNRPDEGSPTVLEVANETTLAGLARLLAEGPGPVAVLNFASAKNPGGGFLGGSQAQEESLARSSALYASLQRAREFYERHRASPSLLYSDAMIASPGCPVFRDDDGALLDEPRLATFLTSAAPNAGALAANRPGDLPQVPEVFRRRSEFVLALAASRGCGRLVLGAWGCGVFRNDPAVVASAFAGHLRRGAWSGRFERVVFAVLEGRPRGRPSRPSGGPSPRTPECAGLERLGGGPSPRCGLPATSRLHAWSSLTERLRGGHDGRPMDPDAPPQRMRCHTPADSCPPCSWPPP